MSDQPDRAVFYFDLGSPYSYLTAERLNQVLPAAPAWRPILLGAVLKAHDRSSWAVSDEREEGMAEVEGRSRERGMIPIRWPDPWPGNTLKAMRAATYAARIGRVEAFALSAFRQAFAAGRDLSEVDNIVLAAASCEIRPKAILKAIETESIKQELKGATDEAIRSGVEGVPTVRVGDRLFWGDDHLELAAASAVESR